MNAFTLDRSNRKLMGVCAGIARATDTDVTLIRIAAVASLFLLGPIAFVLYFATGFIAPDAI